MTNSPEQNTSSTDSSTPPTDTTDDTFIPITITQNNLSTLLNGDTITATAKNNDNTVISITPPETTTNTKTTPQRLLEATVAIIVLLFGIAYATATNFTGYAAYLGLIVSLLGALWILTEIRTLSIKLD